MEAKTTEWRPGPTVCRCCLTEGCYKDISTEYFWMGKREVYAEMLLETFDLNISYSQSGGPNSNSRLICEPCISRLRDAADFKRQVVECERSFTQFLDPVAMADVDVNLELGKEVKLEHVKDEKTLSEEEDDEFVPPDFGDGDDDDDDLDDQPLTKLASKIPKKESVDVLDLLDNAKMTEKRKSSSKSKSSPAKKTKLKKDMASSSKVKPEPRKKKGGSRQTENNKDIEMLDESKIENYNDTKVGERRKYQKSARSQARFLTKKNAGSILECWSGTPFRWKKNRFKCAYCEDNFNDCSDLRAHVRLCSNQYNVNSIFSKFKEMTLINVDVSEAVCRICSEPFREVNEMRNHVIRHGYDLDSSHPDGVIPFCLTKDTWACVLCRETFNNFLKLYEHMNVHYQYHICSICGKGYMTGPRLRKHLELHITGTFPCDKCKKVFTKRTGRDNHKAYAHAKGPRYECPQCNMRFEGYYDRMNHLKQAHREKEVKYSCSHCDLSFKTSGKRAIHVKTVHFPRQSNFNCPYCKTLFKTAFGMKRHMVKHNGESCTVCGEIFTRQRALKEHLASHEDELRCKWCGDSFKERAVLLEHLREKHPEVDELMLTGLVKL